MSNRKRASPEDVAAKGGGGATILTSAVRAIFTFLRLEYVGDVSGSNSSRVGTGGAAFLHWPSFLHATACPAEKRRKTAASRASASSGGALAAYPGADARDTSASYLRERGSDHRRPELDACGYPARSAFADRRGYGYFRQCDGTRGEPLRSRIAARRAGAVAEWVQFQLCDSRFADGCRHGAEGSAESKIWRGHGSEWANSSECG